MTYKSVLIIGPNWPLTENTKKIYEADNCLIIGDGKRALEPEEITTQLQGNIDSNTRIDISGHGNTYNGEHVIELAQGGHLTSDILSAIGQYTQTPTQVHLWSCYGGAAAKDASVLPKGSCLVAHAPEDSTAALAGLNSGLEASVTMHIARPSPATPTLNYQHVLDDLAIGAGQKSFLAVNTGTKKPIIVKDRLPDKMAQRLENGMPKYPDTINAAVKGHYESAFKAITPALKKAKLDGVALASEEHRKDLTTHETQEFYNDRFSYQLAHKQAEAVDYAGSNISEMQKRANHDQSGLLAAVINWSNPIFVKPLLANGFNPHAKISGVAPSSSNYGMSILEHASRNGGASAAIMLLEHDPTIKGLGVLYKTGHAGQVLDWAQAKGKTDIVKNIVNSLDKKQQYKMVKDELSSSFPSQGVVDTLLPNLSKHRVNHLLNKAIENENITGINKLMPRINDFNGDAVQSLVTQAMQTRNNKMLDTLMPAVDKFTKPQVQKLLRNECNLYQPNNEKIYQLLPRVNDFPKQEVQQLLTKAMVANNDKMIDGLMPRVADFTPAQVEQVSIKTIELQNQDRITNLMPHMQKANIGIAEKILHHAMIHNNKEVLNNLLPRTEELSSNKVNHLMQGALAKNNIKVAKHLLPRANELSTDIRKQTIDKLANHAIKKEDHKLMKACIDHTADLNTQQLRSIMSYAVNNDRPQTVKKLLLASTECNKEHVTNQALYSAIEQGNVKTAQLLLKHPTNNNHKVLKEAMDIMPRSLQGSPLHKSMQQTQLSLKPQKTKSRSFVDRFRRSTSSHKTCSTSASITNNTKAKNSNRAR